MIQSIKSALNFPCLILGALLVISSCLVYYSFGNQKPALLTLIDYRVMDMMFNIRGPQPDSKNVVIIDIDEKSLKILGQWPWPRNILADLTQKLHKANVRSVGFDILFAEKDRSSPAFYFQNLDPSIISLIPQDILVSLLNNDALDYDSLFANALGSGPSVLGYAFQTINDGLKSDEDLPFPSSIIRIHPTSFNFKDLSLRSAYRAIVNHPSVAMAETEGFFNVFPDESGTTRQVPLIMMMDDIPYPSLALETFRLGIKTPSITIHVSKTIKTRKPPVLGLQINDRFIPTDSFGQLFINYRGSSGTFKSISAIDILNGKRVSEVTEKFIIIGSSSKGLYDLRTTPFSRAVPGVEINANIIDNLIQSDPFVYDHLTEIGLTYTLIIAGGLLLALILSFLGPLAGSLGAVILILSASVVNYYYFFLNHRYVGMTYPLVTCGFILLITSIYNAFKEQKAKRYIRKAFSHYVSKDVVSELIRNPKALSLKGEEKILTVLFCDIRGFTGISEKMNSRDLGNFMNNYLTCLSHIIMKNKGTVDKFIGDAIMAFWGAPKDDPMHALKSVRAAMEIKAEISNLAGDFANQNLPDIRVGIGINTGLMSVGNFGSKERFDYTVMGDNVNIASRLEGANKNYGTTILISDATKNIIKDTFFCRYIDKVQVKGRSQALDLFEPLTNGIPDAELIKKVEQFEKGVTAYQNQNFKTAKTIMETLYQNEPDRLYQSYLDRINAFIASPPPSEWIGTERRTTLPVNKLTTK
ncbi:MAG: adenylate/guanylate cyclase domain-containing protein [Desulfobacula sp.]|nr:adenylate/guanylate cyclase domain-containing protein [Desulfobacula sp.]